MPSSPNADKKYQNLLNSHSTNGITIQAKGCEQVASSHKLKNSKSNDRVNSGHEVYFSKKMKNKQTRQNGQLKINRKQELDIPTECHKNPMGRHKLEANEKKSSTAKQNSLNKQNMKVDRSNSIKKLKETISKLSSKQKAQPLVLKPKEYSVCEDSRCDLSKMSLKQIES